MTGGLPCDYDYDNIIEKNGDLESLPSSQSHLARHIFLINAADMLITGKI